MGVDKKMLQQFVSNFGYVQFWHIGDYHIEFRLYEIEIITSRGRTIDYIYIHVLKLLLKM